MDISEKIEYWTNLAEYDSIIVRDLLEKGRNLYVGNFGNFYRLLKKYLKDIFGILFAEIIQIPDNIYKSLTSHAVDEIVYLDIPAKNLFAKDLEDRQEMKLVLDTARMYTNGEPGFDISKIFSISTFELG